MRIVVLLLLIAVQSNGAGLERLKYNNPGLTVDLGVGLWAWPLPMDWDGDGDLDMVVACPDKPYNGVYFFENPGDGKGKKFPVFKAAKRVGKAGHNMQVSHVNGRARVLRDGHELIDFRKNGFGKTRKLVSNVKLVAGKTRAKMWRYVDYDGDGDQDLIAGIGYWGDLEWDHAYDAQGVWHNGPLHGYVFLMRNDGSDQKPNYAAERKLTAGGSVIDVYGWPSPNFADFDGDGDLDLLCGEFLDGFTYFENTGSRTQPVYANGRKMNTADGDPLVMDLQMITPTAIDWDGDGDQDLIVGDEDGRVAFVEHTGRTFKGVPQFKAPVYFEQEASTLKYGALATPFCVDWDGDGDEDIISGNTAGYVGFFENLTGGKNPKWARVKNLSAGGKTLRILAGPNGSIQSPCEAKWGYTTLSVADWDHDGLHDLIINSIWGEILWYRNVGTKNAPKLAAAQAVTLSSSMPKPKWFWWDGSENQLVTQWRTTPMAIDFTKDGLTDLVLLDSEGYLCLYERRKKRGVAVLDPPRRVFIDEDNEPIRLNALTAGRSGRYKISVVDWDGDGRLDVLVNSENAIWYRNAETRKGRHVLKRMGNLGKRNVAGHTSSPTVCDFDKDGKPDLLVGAEDGRMYYLNHREAVTWSSIDMAVVGPGESLESMRPGLVKEEFIFTKAKFKECHASTIVETSRGFTAAWFGGTKEGHKDVGIWTSYHDGGGWSGAKEVANGVQHRTDNGEHRWPCWNPVLFQPPGDAPLQLYFKVGPSPQKWWGELLVSYDRGRSFRDQRRLPEGIDGPVKNKPVLLPDGSILAGSSTEYDGWRVHFERTRDLGHSWERVGLINDGKEFNAIQPSILTHKDGRLQILCRSREKAITTSWSKDGGKTWSKMTATTLPNPNAGTDAVTLKDGRQLLVYNHTQRSEGKWRGRNMLNVAVSDDGINWSAAMILEQQVKSEFSYPAVIQSDDGLVHITYTWKRQRVKHVVLDPDELELESIKNGVWPISVRK
ncbi:MAG: exo-alpha-sialidase [Limisphaerales bacterium]